MEQLIDSAPAYVVYGLVIVAAVFVGIERMVKVFRPPPPSSEKAHVRSISGRLDKFEERQGKYEEALAKLVELTARIDERTKQLMGRKTS